MSRLVGFIFWVIAALMYAWRYILPVLVTFGVLLVIGLIEELIKKKR